MPVSITINAVTGQSPYNVYICQSNGTGCFYVDTTATIPFTFNIPSPYDTATAYMLKLIDANNCVITGIKNV